MQKVSDKNLMLFIMLRKSVNEKNREEHPQVHKEYPQEVSANIRLNEKKTEAFIWVAVAHVFNPSIQQAEAGIGRSL